MPCELSDLTPVSQIAKSADVLFVPSSSGIESLHDFVTPAKAEPKVFNCANHGNATSLHLRDEQLKLKAGMCPMHVPYQGSGPGMAALLGGQVTSAFLDARAAYAHLRSDQLTILAVTGSQRFPSLPEVPTMLEAGYKAFEANGWFGLFPPATTPKAIVNKLGDAAAAIIRSPAITKRLLDMG